ncbi:hypothetical protein QTP88_005223 [Uroleucon formosanum]
MDYTFRNLTLSLLEDYQDYTKFYTDGSKTEIGVGASVYFNNTSKMIKFPDFCSIYTAEAYAIYHALETIQQLNIDKAIILSDSLSTINSICNINQPNAISSMIQNLIAFLNHNNQYVMLLWIPSHTGIHGNETADIYAKRAITSPEASLVQICSLGDIKGVIQSLTLQQWQHRWTSSHTKLNEIKPSINPWPTHTSKRRHEEIYQYFQFSNNYMNICVKVKFDKFFVKDSCLISFENVCVKNQPKNDIT